MFLTQLEESRSMKTTFDARAVANLILTEAWGRGVQISNLKLQKLIFLCHAFLLVEKSRDVIGGSFVAWKFGPVHPDVYDAFKLFREKPIKRLAQKRNLVTEQEIDIPRVEDRDVQDVVGRVVAFYSPWTASQLVTLTHAENGPWDVVVKTASANANVGLRISSEIIEQRFKYLWFGAKRDLDGEEPYEDQPLVA